MTNEKKIALTEWQRRETSLTEFTPEQCCLLPLVESCLQDMPKKCPTRAQLATAMNELRKDRPKMTMASVLHQNELKKVSLYSFAYTLYHFYSVKVIAEG